MAKRPIHIGTDPQADLDAMNDWCVANFGNSQKAPKAKGGLEMYVLLQWAAKITTGWATSYGNFYFTKEEDATLFLLRWPDATVIAR